MPLSLAGSSVDPVLARIISHVESSGLKYALRFEPGIFAGLATLGAAESAELDHIAHLNLCSYETARVIYSTSFGFYQIMGFNIYALGWDGPILSWWQDINAQNAAFAAFLDKNDINFTWAEMSTDSTKLGKFARVYNGNEASYSARMLAIAAQLGVAQ